jgi:hypothetical protein
VQKSDKSFSRASAELQQVMNDLRDKLETLKVQIGQRAERRMVTSAPATFRTNDVDKDVVARAEVKKALAEPLLTHGE